MLLKFCLRRGLVAAFVAVLASLTLAPRGAAQTFTWTGGSGNNRWTSGNNWSGGVAPTGAGGENLVFPSGAARLSNNNTLNGASFNSITISGSGYTLSGNALTLGAGGLADNSIAGTNRRRPNEPVKRRHGRPLHFPLEDRLCGHAMLAFRQR